MNNVKVKIEESWAQMLENEFDKPYFQYIIRQVKTFKEEQLVIFPPGPKIFNAFDSTPFHQVKAIIIGQDPYHRKGQAMGLSFSVPRTMSIPPSLRNIYKEMDRDLGIKPATHGDLSAWATQGVFLLNAILTVEEGKPGSHKDLGWHLFTDAVIRLLSEKRENLIFLLWGNFAKQKKALIDNKKHLILESAHPSPLAGNAFQGCAHFSKANQYLVQNNLEPIDWQIK